MKTPLIAAGLALAFALAGQAGEKPVLKVYTYSSFASDWGPGPQIEKAFEKTCGCDLQWVTAGDGAALLGRLKLEGDKTEADVVLGLDTNLIVKARETGLFAKAPEAPALDNLPVAWADPDFLPFDWGYFAFVYDKTRLAKAPKSFHELVAAPDDLRIVIEDPRSSTPGLGLLLWVKAAYGDKAAEIWRGLRPKIVTVTKGWSEAYGMFLEGEADMVLSYTTSPAYHINVEKDDTKAAAIFDEGHYMQIEVMGITRTSDQPELARRFVRFMLSDEAQAIIPVTNWMYPVRMPPGDLPAGFEQLVPREKAILLPPEEAARLREAALAEWLAVMSE